MEVLKEIWELLKSLWLYVLYGINPKTWIKILLGLWLVSSISLYCYYKVKINKLEKAHAIKVEKLEDHIYELEVQLLDKIDYQKIKEIYEKKSDTNRVITNSKLDSLLSRYYY